jgi:RimJ/RimL family protein N-acetyltransferase
VTWLRRVAKGDLNALSGQRESVELAGEMAWYGFRDAGWLHRRFEANEIIRDDAGMLAVVDDDDRLVGEVSWIRMHNGPPPNGYCWNVGIWILPAERGKGHGSEAQRLAAAYLFEHTYLERVEAGTESGNLAEQRALEKAGFTREGTLRKACFRGGEWRDMVVFSKLRGEP